MAPVPGSPWKCVSRMTSLPPSPHTHTYMQLLVVLPGARSGAFVTV